MIIGFDNNDSCYGKMDNNDLLKCLVDEIIRDGINRLDENNDTERIKDCLEELKVLALKSQSVNYLMCQLSAYGWYFIDLTELHNHLYDFRTFIESKGIVTKEISNVLKLIESEMIK